MRKKPYSFYGFETDAEVEFIKREVERTNTNVSAVIKKLIQNAMGGEEKELKEPKDQIEILKAKLEELKKIGLFAAESAVYAGHIAQANYIELAGEDQDKIDETKKYAAELTKKEMKKIQ